MNGNIDLTRRGAYHHWARDVLRYGDTDRQGHVNNAVFATFCETGRCALLFDPARPALPENAAFVLARLILDYRAEILWPGTVEIGTAVLRMGNSSVTFVQGLFVGETCCATAETVIVLTDTSTRRSRPFPEDVRAWLLGWRHPDVPE